MSEMMPAGALLQAREHPLRRQLAGEVHARPYEILAAPVRASHLAVLHGDGLPAAEERAFLAELLAIHGAEPPGEGATFFSRPLGALRLRWERHMEFSTYTFLRQDFCEQPFLHTALDLVPAEWIARRPGQLMSAIHVCVDRSDRSIEEVTALFDGNMPIGSKVVGGAGAIYTDFRLHADGFSRALIRDGGLTKGQTGRVLQRVMEIETYRMMALLAFPPAREAAAEAGRMDRALAAIVSELADPDILQDDRSLLERLTRLAAESETLDASTNFRLAAARAYHAIVVNRILELREERIVGLQTVAEFMERRLTPAMKTCESAAERLQLLAHRVSRAGELLRTRVDIALEEKNRDLLKSMNQRAKLQLRLQETVEGLSVVAISYYLLGLVGYVAKGLKSVGLPLDSDIAALVALPVIVAAAWLGMRRLRHALTHDGD